MFDKEESIKFIQSLAQGIDPLTGELIENDSILNRSDIIRNLYNIKDYLETIKDKKTVKVKKEPFILTNGDVIRNGDVTITEFVNTINELNCHENMRKADYRIVLDWLVLNDYLYINDYNKKQPTKKGEDLGITFNIKRYNNGNYYYCTYDEDAQRFILQNIIDGKIDFNSKIK